MVSKGFAILFASAAPIFLAAAQVVETVPRLAGKSVVCVVRNQYPTDHHNTANIFQKGEINQSSWEKAADGGSSLIKIDFDASGKPKIETLLSLPEGIVRDPEVSPDAARRRGRGALLHEEHSAYFRQALREMPRLRRQGLGKDNPLRRQGADVQPALFAAAFKEGDIRDRRGPRRRARGELVGRETKPYGENDPRGAQRREAR